LPLEYLVTRTIHVPAGTSEQAAQDVRVREAARASEPAPQEYLLGPWRSLLLPGKGQAKEPAGQATARPCHRRAALVLVMLMKHRSCRGTRAAPRRGCQAR
jgi:hypothetical protein